jgi:hypothetical protein
MRLDKALINPLSLSLALATVASFSLPKAAQAALFNFSYTASTGVLTGMLEGDLQADNDTVIVSAVTMAAFNGVPGPALPFLSSATTAYGGPLVPPTVSLSGLNLDLAAFDSIAAVDGFVFAPASFFGFPFFVGGSSFGATGFELYDPTKWSLTPKSVPVPEPSAVVALALVGGGLLLSKRRKAA